ncbi:hypothetical protein IWW45_004592, partial [Coemansia sp. RSA 485]
QASCRRICMRAEQRYLKCLAPYVPRHCTSLVAKHCPMHCVQSLRLWTLMGCWHTMQMWWCAVTDTCLCFLWMSGCMFTGLEELATSAQAPSLLAPRTTITMLLRNIYLEEHMSWWSRFSRVIILNS